MISVVVFKWQKPGYRSTFTHRHVNTTRRMVARHYPYPHRFICVTDDPVGLDDGIEYVQLWDDYANIPNPSWPQGPSCYRRLKVFSDEFAQIAGDRIVCIDLDAVITGDLTALFDRTEDFLIWKTGNPKIPFCASMFMFTSGVHTRLWTDFNPSISPRVSLKSGMKGSDQSWIADCLGLKLPGWGIQDGVYGYKDHLLKGLSAPLPTGARVVFFNGKPDPWEDAAVVRAPWIKKHYL